MKIKNIMTQKWIEGLILSENAEPKREIMLFPYGKYTHDSYGELNFDNVFFNEIIDNFQNNVLGIKPFMDVEHRMGESLAWFDETPYIKNGIGLFARPNWTSKGKTLTQEKQYMYFSPWYENFKNPKDGKEYKNVFRGGAATNIPFLKTMPPIVDTDGKYSERKQIRIQLNEIYSNETSDNAGAHGDEGNKADKVKTDMKIYTEDTKMVNLLKALGLDEKASEEQAIAKLAEITKTNKEAVESAKKMSENKDDSKLLAENIEIKNQIVKMQENITKEKAENLIEKKLSDGIIIPADKDFWMKRLLSDFTGTSEIIAKMQKVVNLGEIGSEGADSGNETLEVKAVKLTETKKIKLSAAFDELLKDNKNFDEYVKKFHTKKA